MFGRNKNLLKDSFFDDINGKSLDLYQRKIIIDNSNEILVVASAGSGKTLTIIGKIKYLIEKKYYQEAEILCLSFTNEAVNNLKEKLSFNVDVLTFHRLSLNILKENNVPFYIASDSLLQYIINEYFKGYIVKRRLLIEYFDKKMKIEDILADNRLEYLKSNILSFIKKIKCNNLQIENLRQIIKKCNNTKEKIFMFFALDILKIYQEELFSECKIDFDDMITYACELVRQNGIKKKYRYIIIDEYQDISQTRFILIREIINNTNAKIMCVGDDYQSIYGFSGSNINLFVNFFHYFPLGKRMDIPYSYRNSYQLVHIASKFITKNNYQLHKNTKATFLLKYPIIIVYYDNLGESYTSLLNYLYLEAEKEILVLARYNSDFKLINNTKSNSFLNIRYLTIHMSKGLECDNVILLKVSDEYLGLPSKIKNDEIFSLIENEEEYPYAEERRLFYVALTRCKKRIYLLVPRKNPSIFIKEIQNRCVELLLK